MCTHTRAHTLFLSAAHMLITTVCRGLSHALGTWCSAGRGEGGHWTEASEWSAPQMPCEVDRGCYGEGKWGLESLPSLSFLTCKPGMTWSKQQKTKHPSLFKHWVSLLLSPQGVPGTTWNMFAVGALWPEHSRV